MERRKLSRHAWSVAVPVMMLLVLIALMAMKRRGAPDTRPASGSIALTRPDGDLTASPESDITSHTGEFPTHDDTVVALNKVESESMKDRKVEVDQVRRLEDWNEFYATAKALDMAPKEYQRLIIDRLAKQLGLSDSEHSTLTKLLRNEQQAVTDAAVSRFGSQQALRDQSRGDRSLTKQFWKDMHELRETTRRSYDSSYSEVFKGDRMTTINEHLRNQSIGLITSFAGPEMKVHVWGVGKWGMDD